MAMMRIQVPRASLAPPMRGRKPANSLPSDFRMDPRASTLLHLQACAGNRAVQRLVACATVQRCGPNSDCDCATEERAHAEHRPRATHQPAVVQRAAKIVDQRHLESDLFKTDPRLDAAFHNDPTLTAADNGLSVSRMQQALDAAMGPMPKSRRTTPAGTVSWDGQWGSETSQWVRDFQTAHHIPPGGFEAGRRTLDALDADAKRRQLPAPKPTPPTPPAPKAKKVCGPNVSDLVQKTWTQIQKDYEGFSLGTRVNACRMLVQP
jgi:hypothetical protein